MSPGIDLFVDEGQVPIRINIERPPFRDGSSFVNDAVRFGDLFAGITQNRIIQLLRKLTWSWQPIADAENEAKVDAALFECNICGSAGL